MSTISGRNIILKSFDGLENDVIYAGDTLGSSGYETVTSGYDTLNISLPDDQPLSQNFLAQSFCIPGVVT